MMTNQGSVKEKQISCIRDSERNKPRFCLLPDCCQRSPHKLSGEKLICDKRERSLATISQQMFRKVTHYDDNCEHHTYSMDEQ